MSSAYYPYRSSRIHYSCWGQGPRLLFCFHGYGESGASFELLEDALGAEFTLVAIDLPFHGGTEWADGLYFDPGDCLRMIEAIAAGLAGSDVGWALLGYSMGGRIALQLLELAPEKVSRVVLLAPDGMTVNPWYWLATRTTVGKRLFRWTMRNPGWLFFLLSAGNRLHLANPSLFKFASHYIDNDPIRQLLYARWTTMRGFAPRLGSIAGHIHKLRIPVVLIYGIHDRVIRPRRGERFLRRIRPNGRLVTLPAGHALLQPKFVEVIANAVSLPTLQGS